MPKRVQLPKAEQRALSHKNPHELSPRNRKLLDEYLRGDATQKEIREKYNIKCHGYFSRLMYRPKVKEYIREYYQKQREFRDESYKIMSEAIRRIIARQIDSGKVETRKYYDKAGKLVSRVEIETPWTIRDMVEMAKVAGDYNPSLTVRKEEFKNKEEDYTEVLEQLKVLKQKGA